MAHGIIAKKIGMTRLFNEDGSATPVTVLQAGPCPVVAVRSEETDGYVAAQLAWDTVPERKLSKAELGHLKASGVDGSYRRLVEIRDFDPARVGGFFKGIEKMSPARIGARVIAALNWMQDNPGHPFVSEQLQLVALNLKHLEE